MELNKLAININKRTKAYHFVFENIWIGVTIKERRESSYTPDDLRREYRNLLMFRNNIDIPCLLIGLLIKAFYKSRKESSYKKKIEKYGLNSVNLESIIYKIINDDIKSGIITPKMVEDIS